MGRICIIHSVQTSKVNSLTYQENTMEITLYKVQSKYASAIARKIANLLKKLINSYKILEFNCIIKVNTWTLTNTEANRCKSTLSILKPCICLHLIKISHSKFGLKYKRTR